jgi:NNP family nitrate/nitrite transporter-like MFS transporter
LRFKNEIGVITGIVGAAGGVGGFFLPTVLGFLNHQTGSYSGGFFAFGITAMICAGTLALVSRNWEGVFVGRGGTAVTEPATEAAPQPVPEPAQASA